MALFVTTDFPPHRGGIQRMIAKLAGEFSELGQQVIVVAPKFPGSSTFDDAQRYRVSRFPRHGRVRAFVAMVAHVLWAHATSRSKITIAATWFPAGLAACCIPPLIRGRLIVLAHGAEIAFSRGNIRRNVMRYVFRCADDIVANSNYTRHLLRRAGIAGAIRVIHPGVDAEEIQPARSLRPTILSVGRLVDRKGFDTTIAALPAIIKRYPGTRYEIVGSGPQRQTLEALARKLNVADHVAFLGPLADEEMREAYARAWIFSLPARTINDDVEGFGIVYLEAAIAQLPAVGGLNSGAEDAIVHGVTGLLVDGTSTMDVAAALMSLIGDPERSRRMGVQGRDRAVSHFSWVTFASKLVHVGSEPLSGSKKHVTT